MKQDASVSVSMGMSSTGSDEEFGILDPNMTVKVLSTHYPMNLTYMSGTGNNNMQRNDIFAQTAGALTMLPPH